MNAVSKFIENLKHTSSIVLFLVLIWAIVAYGIIWLALDSFIFGGGALFSNPYTITASSYISNFVPSLAFDGVSTDSSAWQASRASLEPEWIKCEFTRSKRITSLSLQAQGGNKNNLKRAPKDFILQGSNDDRDYEDLLKVTDDVYSEPGEWHSWRFKNYDSYKYYRIYVTKNAGAQDVFFAIQEIKMR